MWWIFWELKKKGPKSILLGTSKKLKAKWPIFSQKKSLGWPHPQGERKNNRRKKKENGKGERKKNAKENKEKKKKEEQNNSSWEEKTEMKKLTRTKRKKKVKELRKNEEKEGRIRHILLGKKLQR